MHYRRRNVERGREQEGEKRRERKSEWRGSRRTRFNEKSDLVDGVGRGRRGGLRDRPRPETCAWWGGGEREREGESFESDGGRRGRGISGRPRGGISTTSERKGRVLPTYIHVSRRALIHPVGNDLIVPCRVSRPVRNGKGRGVQHPRHGQWARETARGTFSGGACVS